MTRGLLGIIKLVLFFVLVPALVAVIMGFMTEMKVLVGNGSVFWYGVIAYVIVHLFVFTPQAIYRFWQGVLMEIFAFTGVVANAIVVCVPIIPIVLLIISFLAKVIFNQEWGNEFLLCTIGFAMALHVILSAQELYENDDSHLKGHYLLNILLVVIVNIFLIVLLMDLVFPKFAFLSFWDNSIFFGSKIYTGCLQQI